MTTRTETLAAGQSFFIEGSGRFFQCHYATAELEFRVTVGGNRYDWAPLDRGIGWREDFEAIEVRNPTGASQTVTVVHHTLSGYFDQRELAAQIAVDGGIVTNTAPSTDQGGAITPIGESYTNLDIDNTAGGATDYTEVISAASNVNGVRIRVAILIVKEETNGHPDWRCAQIKSGASFFAEQFDPGQFSIRDIEIPAGQSVIMQTHRGVRATLKLAYDLV
ncbi:hypothetical protein [Kordiimonas sp.]|uniref:hypothetical protein n=1 Tax=Kordiimonas sp. TaxID=1970157 RepID=UPI003B523E99